MGVETCGAQQDMMIFKVIETVSGSLTAVHSREAEGRPRSNESLIWQGEASDKLEALKKATEADSRVDLRYMRIRHERDLERE